jgi:kynureninase
MEDFIFSRDFVLQMDARDPLSYFRRHYHFPHHNGVNALYFAGNSLGLQPKTARAKLEQELDDWADFGVEGHFKAKHPWVNYHEMFSTPLGRIIGAHPEEIVVMNGLTTNLHLLMVSFYRPTPDRFKVLVESKAFPSDQYAVDSQVRFHGYDPEKAIIEVSPRDGEHTIREEDIIENINKHGDELALVFIGGVNYYSGQYFDIQSITKEAKRVGARVGWDLAHAAGNVPLRMHDWEADFAAWCSYKYLNSGPGSISGVFVHKQHHGQTDIPRFEGWWGHDKNRRFEMEPKFYPVPTAEAWQLSNAPVFSMATHRAALDLFDEAGIEALRLKSMKLTNYLEQMLKEISRDNDVFEVITPEDPERRGAQLSVLTHGHGKELFDKLTAKGVIADWREPNVIRLAPVPMYNSFQDIFDLGMILKDLVS